MFLLFFSKRPWMLLLLLLLLVLDDHSVGVLAIDLVWPLLFLLLFFKWLMLIL